MGRKGILLKALPASGVALIEGDQDPGQGVQGQGVAAGDLEAVFLFDITGEQPGPWQLVVSSGKCLAIPEMHEAPTVTIHTTSQTLLDIFRQRLDARRAIAKGELKVSGDRRLFMRFGRLFPPPAG